MAAARNIKPLLAEGMNVKVIVLPDGEDPDTLAKGKTCDELPTYLTSASLDFLDFYTTYIINKESAIPARAAAITTLLQAIATIPDEIKKSLYLSEVQRRFALTPDAIPQALGTETLTARIERLEAEVEELKIGKMTKNNI